MQRAREALHKIASDVLHSAPAEDAAVIAWPLVCGTAVAAKTRALSFTPSDGELRVLVPDSAWQSQLSSFASPYMEALNELVNQKVASIRFVLTDDKKEAQSA